MNELTWTDHQSHQILGAEHRGRTVEQEARETFPERFDGKSDRAILHEIAAAVRQAEGAAV